MRAKADEDVSAFKDLLGKERVDTPAQMKEEAILIGISQLGAIFVGFIAIFVIFTQSTSKLSSGDTVRARIIIHSSFAVVLAALSPLVLNGLGIAPSWLWRLATGIHLLLGGTITFNILRSQRTADKTKTPDRGSPTRKE